MVNYNRIGEFSYISSIKQIISILLLVLISFNGVAQNYADKEYYLIDSLDMEQLTDADLELLEKSLRAFHESQSDTSKIEALTNICENMMHEHWKVYQMVQLDLIQSYIKQQTDPYSKRRLLLYYAYGLNNLGAIQETSGNLKNSIKTFQKSIRLFELLNDSVGLADPNTNLSGVYRKMGDIKKSLECDYKGLKIYEAQGDSLKMAYVLNSLGRHYKQQLDFKQALTYFERSLAICKNHDIKELISIVILNISAIHEHRKEFDQALIKVNEALSISTETGQKVAVAECHLRIGGIYAKQGMHLKALDYYQKALELYQQLNRKLSIANLYGVIGSAYYHLEDYKKAESYKLLSHQIGSDMGSISTIKNTSRDLSSINTKLGNHKEALKYYKQYIEVRDSILNEENQKATIRQQTQYEFEKEQIRKENEAKEQARIAEEATSRRNNLQYSLIFLGILLLFGIVLSLGFIKVSANIAEGLIFFAFLILFEFVLVFTEPYLENYTNGEPMYNLLANSVLALIIFPLHAVLERLLKKRIVK